LHSTWPAASIDVLTSPAGAEALAGLTSIDRLIAVEKHRFDSPASVLSPSALTAVWPTLRELRARHYDYLLLMHHLTTRFGAAKYRALVRVIGAQITVGLDNGRGGFLDLPVEDRGFGLLHEADYASALVERMGAHVAPRQLEIAIDGLARREAARLLGSDRWLAVHVGGGIFSLARRWDPAGFAAAANEIARRTCARVVLLGTSVDRQATDATLAQLSVPALDLVDRLSAKLTAAVLERCALLLSNDSGVVHLGAAVGTPVVAVFGPTNDLAWGPYPPEKHAVVRVTLPCSPCAYRGTGLGTPQGCPTRDCLQLVTPRMVVQAAERLLARQPAPGSLREAAPRQGMALEPRPNMP
ncbi:MAG: glycosyltransferase family 9 protein, partial [Chloroflexota bacterium]